MRLFVHKRQNQSRDFSLFAASALCSSTIMTMHPFISLSIHPSKCKVEISDGSIHFMFFWQGIFPREVGHVRPLCRQKSMH